MGLWPAPPNRTRRDPVAENIWAGDAGGVSVLGGAGGASSPWVGRPDIDCDQHQADGLELLDGLSAYPGPWSRHKIKIRGRQRWKSIVATLPWVARLSRRRVWRDRTRWKRPLQRHPGPNSIPMPGTSASSASCRSISTNGMPKSWISKNMPITWPRSKPRPPISASPTRRPFIPPRFRTWSPAAG